MRVEDSNRLFRRSRFYPLPRDLCFDSERPLFRKYAAGKKMLVEIGVFEGAASVAFRSVMSPDAVLHLIDPFVPDSMNPDLRGRKFFAWLNVARVFNGKVQWHQDYSWNVAKGWDAPIDFLFIDGDHTADSCRKDWEFWSPFVQKGGNVLFHDARHGKGDGSFWDGWEGPTRVVDELFRLAPIPGWRIVAEAGTVIVVERTS